MNKLELIIGDPAGVAGAPLCRVIRRSDQQASRAVRRSHRRRPASAIVDGLVTRHLQALAAKLPGTHETCAIHPLSTGPIAECQGWSVEEQLNHGIRYLNIRCRHPRSPTRTARSLCGSGAALTNTHERDAGQLRLRPVFALLTGTVLGKSDRVSLTRRRDADQARPYTRHSRNWKILGVGTQRIPMIRV
jgi:hypothetical protein